MAIEVRCPSGHRLSVEDRHAGKRLKCPKCQKVVAVPQPDPKSGIEKVIRAAPPPLPPRRKSASKEEGSTPSTAATWVAEAANEVALVPTVQPEKLGYQVESHHAHTVYAIAVGLAVLAIFQLSPAIKRGEFSTAPAWAQCVMLLAVIQLVYAAWLALAPDWCTLWVAMLAFAGVATLYGAALAIAVMTPRDSSLVLGMDDVREAARLWCSAVILLTTFMTYVCGRASYRWYKIYQKARQV